MLCLDPETFGRQARTPSKEKTHRFQRVSYSGEAIHSHWRPLGARWSSSCPAGLGRSIEVGAPTRPGGCSQARRARQEAMTSTSFSSQAGASSQDEDVPPLGEIARP